MRVRAHVFVSGQVQGVFFRSSTRNQARVLGLLGWARNLSDGRVEIMIEGEKDAVDRLIEFCRDGPLEAAVEDIEISWEKPTGKFKEFEVR
jgi:acylphosphatase